MKYGKKYMFVACAALLLGMQSCDLEEYNPAGSTPDNVYKEQAGFEALVNSAYAFWGGQFYGREDFVLLLNGGGDLWINIANCGYGRQMSKYEELTASVGQIKNTWNRLYEIINDCTPEEEVEIPIPDYAAGWIDFWRGGKYQGGQSVDIDVDMEKIPLFVKAGSIIPFGPVKQYTSQEEGENESLEIRIYPGADASFMIYEDEGNNYNYEKGQFSTIELNWNDAKKELEIGKRKGVFPGMKGKRTFNIVLVSPQSEELESLPLLLGVQSFIISYRRFHVFLI